MELANFSGRSLLRLQVDFDSPSELKQMSAETPALPQTPPPPLIAACQGLPPRGGTYTHHAAPWHAIVLRTGIDGPTCKDDVDGFFNAASRRKTKMLHSFSLPLPLDEVSIIMRV